ncbi:branched-chain amino acid ABC transporter substrate-binding protein [Candidatus Solirubrobacter pratensis]|uniref:branched-chain amino acid ABC transporter substrate-binding protein n=1 Tax=Candidatus Solirubrobacter pratensis TaxID=1298857 RepID=UPI00041BFAE1|nr:branched-chain amino acid ABC transporter substrate-binding protein [Candidatus Solirubrobacter pratensis]
MRPILLAAALLAATPAAASAEAKPTVYSSLPLHGASRSTTQAINRGARMALRDAGSPVRFVALDDSTARAGAWTPSRAAGNARRVARDPSALAFVGAFNSGASAVALPILNRAGVPMISPTNTALGLTRDGAGAHRGEPGRYYPSGQRTYFRLMPNDSVQGGALATAMRDRGCRAVASITDSEIYGKGLGSWLRAYAQQIGVPVVKAQAIRARRSYRSLARGLKAAGVDCVAYTGITAGGAVRVFKDVGAALPKARLFGSDGVAETGLTAHLPRSVARRTFVIVSIMPGSAYPPAGQALLRRAGRNVDPDLLYGYEAMKLVTDAVAAGARDKAGVLGFLRGVNGRQGVIGTYGFDANGDTTMKQFGLYVVRGGVLRSAGVVIAP